MKIKHVYIIFLIFLMPMLIKAVDSSYDYDEVRALGGFQSECLKNACYIEPSGELLSENEKSDLILSRHLGNVHTLSFANQNIDDDFIRQLSNHSSLSKIINLNLSGNLGVTMESINSILESEILGKSRDLPQISGRFGIHSSTIYINARNTRVVPPQEGANYFEKHRFDFIIDYSYNQICMLGGMKFVEVTLR